MSNLHRNTADTDMPGCINIGSRLELFVDEYLIEKTSGELRLNMHRPEPRGIVFTCDQPWEGNGSSFQSIVRDGSRFLLYYRGGHHIASAAYQNDKISWETLCVAESTDGIHWNRPELGIIEFRGSKKNNLILDQQAVAEIAGSPAHTSVFKDANPDCPASEKFKIVIVGHKPTGLYLLVSADGYHFQLKSTTPFMRHGAFDSQNLAFYDTVRQEYRVYHRGFNGSVRDVLTSAAKDFDSFPEPQWISYPGSPTMSLYTNQIAPYYRAPHIFMGFPMRYCERAWGMPLLDLPGLENRLERAKHHPRYATAITDTVFMSSRDALTFNRRPEAFLRPGPRQVESWVYGDTFICWGMLETTADIEDAPAEISLYAVESYWEGEAVKIRRHTLRQDGFVSAYAPYAGGELVTKPLVFSGGVLAVNAATSAFGSFQVELQAADGQPLPGFELENCEPIFCDTIQHVVHWQDNSEVSHLAGQPVRIRFVLKDADIYSFQFLPPRPPREKYAIPGTEVLPKKNAAREPFSIMDDDFQRVKPGGMPFVGDGDSGWQLFRAHTDRLLVLNEAENHFLRINCVDEDPESLPSARIIIKKQDTVDLENGSVILNLRLRVPETNQGAVKLVFKDIPASGDQRYVICLALQPDGSFSYIKYELNPSPEDKYNPWKRKLARSVPVAGMAFPTGRWFGLELGINLQSADYTLSVDSGKSVALPFANPDIHRLQSFNFHPENPGTGFDLDSVRIQAIPI